MRVLKDVKIPENAEAIGKAASFGDLSENSEWEAAIEEQRILTNRAMALELELGEAQLLDDAPIHSEVVSPGTRVAYREVDSGAEHRIELVGPWDAEEEHQVSYRSPLGQGMLGKRAGQRATLTLPTGPLEIELLEVETLVL